MEPTPLAIGIYRDSSKGQREQYGTTVFELAELEIGRGEQPHLRVRLRDTWIEMRRHAPAMHQPCGRNHASA